MTWLAHTLTVSGHAIDKLRLPVAGRDSNPRPRPHRPHAFSVPQSVLSAARIISCRVFLLAVRLTQCLVNWLAGGELPHIQYHFRVLVLLAFCLSHCILLLLCSVITPGGNSSVGRASDWLSQAAILTRPVRVPDAARDPPPPPPPDWVNFRQSRLSGSVRTLKIPNTSSHTIVSVDTVHENTTLTPTGMGGAAAALAASGKATRISRKGQRSTKKEHTLQTATTIATIKPPKQPVKRKLTVHNYTRRVDSKAVNITKLQFRPFRASCRSPLRHWDIQWVQTIHIW